MYHFNTQLVVWVIYNSIHTGGALLTIVSSLRSIHSSIKGYLCAISEERSSTAAHPQSSKCMPSCPGVCWMYHMLLSHGSEWSPIQVELFIFASGVAVCVQRLGCNDDRLCVWGERILQKHREGHTNENKPTCISSFSKWMTALRICEH